MQHVTVTEYDPRWEKLFEEEKRLIASILGDNAAEIYHIGSTAVHALAAKPIIDVMPMVYSLPAVDEVKGAFERAGYEYLGEFGIKGRRYMRKGGDERTHQVHVFHVSDRQNVCRHLAVRDYLRAHPDEASAYAQLKKRLAAQFPYDIESYCDGKAQFVTELERKALQYYDCEKR